MKYPTPNETAQGILESALGIIRKSLTENKISQQQLADNSGLSRVSINRLLSGKVKNPSYLTITALLLIVSGQETP